MTDSEFQTDDPPVIVLVGPQLGENIGMCARAMLNCGLDRLRLVRPRDGWPNPAAVGTAADADAVIAGITCFDTLDDAVADCRRVFAATARRRTLRIPALELGDAISEIRTVDPGLGATPRAAIVFGPEASGLDNESVSRADRLIYFPTNPKFSSLNLAQAVLLFGWEWWRSHGAAAANPAGPVMAGDGSAGAPPAEKAETTIFLTRLEQALESTGFFLTPELRPDTARNLRSFFTRANPSVEELCLLHGVLTALTRPKR